MIPFTLAENAGLNPISTVTALRARHKEGETMAGINVRKVGRSLASRLAARDGADVALQGTITNILEENVVQPLLVSTSALTLATETVRSIMKIDDIVTIR